MTRRLWSVCLGTATLLLVPSLTPPTVANPPDLPILSSNIVVPRLLGLPLDSGEPTSGCLVLPAEAETFWPQMALVQLVENNAFRGAGQELRVQVQEAPSDSVMLGVGVNSDVGIAVIVTPAAPATSPRPMIPMPALARLSPTVRRNLAASLLFVVHPLMVLMPTDQLLDMPSDHPQPTPAGDSEEKPLSTISYPMNDMDGMLWWIDNSPPSSGTFISSRAEEYQLANAIYWKGLIRRGNRSRAVAPQVASDCGLDGNIVLNERNFDIASPSCPQDAPASSECPWMREHATEPPACAKAVPEKVRTVTENLRDLRKAARLLKQGEKLGKAGHVCEALDCFEKARQLCPGSTLEERAEQAAAELFPFLEEESPMTEDSAKEQDAPQEDQPTPAQKLERQLKTPVTVSFTDAPLGQILDDLRSWQSINIYIDMPALEEEGILLDRPTTIKVEQASLQTVLGVIVRNAGLTYIVKDNVVLVTTEKHAAGKLMTGTYPVGDLVSDVQVRALIAMGKETTWLGTRSNEAALIEFITSTITPNSWAEKGGPGMAEYCATTKSLVVMQTPDNQEQVAHLLQTLRLAKDDANYIREQEGHCTRRGDEDCGARGETPSPPRVCPHWTMQPPLPPVDPQVVSALEQVLSDSQKDGAGLTVEVEEKSTTKPAEGTDRPEVVVEPSISPEIQQMIQAFVLEARVREMKQHPKLDLTSLFGFALPDDFLGGSIEIGTDMLGLRVQCDLPCNGTMCHVLYNRGAWAVWKTSEVETSKSESKPR
jgi:hypothetical protein